MDTGTSVLDALVKELEERKQARDQALITGEKHDAPGSPATAGYLHGPGGVLSWPGVDPRVFHTVVGPHSLLGQLPATGSPYTSPVYATITGVTGETGSEPAANCDPSPVAGQTKSCITLAPFGKFKRQTAELELSRLNQRVDRADPMDLQLIGTPFGQATQQQGVFGGGPDGIGTPVDVLTNELANRIWNRNVAFFRLLSRQLWTGTPANNVGTAYQEFSGLQTLVSTGYVDAQTNVACPAVDSYVRDFSFGRIDISPGDSNIVAAVTDMYYQLRSRADRTGMAPVRWAVAMREQFFYELTAVWPCAYLTYRCQTQGNERLVIDGNEQVAMRDRMRQGKYLLIDGVQIPVVFDDGIPEDSNTTNGNVVSGCFSSDIYFLPFSVVGGQSVLFLEFFEFQNPAVRDALGNMVLGTIEGNGAFITWPVQTRGCFQLETEIQPRVVLRTPWLAARLQNVQYCPTQHVRDDLPDDPYFVDGGQTSRERPSLFAHWD